MLARNALMCGSRAAAGLPISSIFHRSFVVGANGCWVRFPLSPELTKFREEQEETWRSKMIETFNPLADELIDKIVAGESRMSVSSKITEMVKGITFLSQDDKKIAKKEIKEAIVFRVLGKILATEKDEYVANCVNIIATSTKLPFNEVEKIIDKLDKFNEEAEKKIAGVTDSSLLERLNKFMRCYKIGLLVETEQTKG